MRPHLERIERPEGASLRAFERRDRHYPFDWHHHPELELTLIARGAGRRYAGDAVEDYAGGDCVLLGPWLPHTWASHGRGEQVALVVQFGQEWVEKLCAAAAELSCISTLLERSRRGLRVTGAGRLGVAQSMRALVDAKAADRVLMLLKILDMIARSRACHPLASPAYVAGQPVVDRRLEAVNQYLRKQITEEISQRDAADIAGLTPAAFCRFFKRSTGRSFVHHVHELRVGRACQLLTEGERDITDICFASGFGNVSNFNRIFRRLKNTAPHRYRASFRGTDSAE